MVDYEMLESEYGSPLYVTDLGIIRERYDKLQEKIKNIKVKYACKSNFDPLILEEIENKNGEFVAGSSSEAVLAHNNGVSVENLQVTAVSPNKQSINQLVKLSKFDDRFKVTVNEYDTVVKLCESDYEGEIFIRLKADKEFMSSKKYEDGSMLKFGMTSKEVKKSIKKIKSSKPNLVGFHSHLGGSIMNNNISNFVNHAEDIINRSTSYLNPDEIKYINFGGGFGIPKRPSDKPLNIEELSKKLNEVLYIPDIEYVVEPGRYISGPSTVLLTKVQAVRDESDGKFVGVDAGMSHYPRTTMFDVYQHIKNTNNRKNVRQTVSGPTCSGADIFCHDRKFSDSKVGDILIIEDVGCYGIVMSGRFHGYKYPKVITTDERESPISNGLNKGQTEI